jgi:hypothetical protein
LCFGVERVKQHLEKIEGVVKYGQLIQRRRQH